MLENALLAELLGVEAREDPCIGLPVPGDPDGDRFPILIEGVDLASLCGLPDPTQSRSLALHACALELFAKFIVGRALSRLPRAEGSGVDASSSAGFLVEHSVADSLKDRLATFGIGLELRDASSLPVPPVAAHRLLGSIAMSAIFWRTSGRDAR